MWACPILCTHWKAQLMKKKGWIYQIHVTKKNMSWGSCHCYSTRKHIVKTPWCGWEANSRITEGMWQHIDCSPTGLPQLCTGILLEGGRKQGGKFSCNTGTILLNSQLLACMKLSIMVTVVQFLQKVFVLLGFETMGTVKRSFKISC